MAEETPQRDVSHTDTQKTLENAKTPEATPSKPKVEEPKSSQYKPFSTDTLYSLLVAELAASRQSFDITLAHYVEQARLTNDKNVIIRAARIAQFFKSHQQSLDMGLLWLAQEPDNIEANTLVANSHLELGEPLIALDYVEKLFTLVAPAAFEGTGGFTETIANFSKQADKKTLSTLIQRYTQLQQTHPTLSSIPVGLSVLYQSNGEIAKALDWVQQALTLDPEKTSAIVQEILLIQQNQQTDLALTKLKQHLDKNPNNNRLRLFYARLLTETDVEQAYQQFTLLSKQSPYQFDLKYSRALIATELGKIAEAKPLFLDLLKVDYQVDTVNFYLGHIDEALQQLSSAINYYLAVTQGENYLPSRNRAARILISQNKDDQAQALFASLRKELPDKTEILYVAETNLLTSNQRDDRALPLLNQAINAFPDNASLRYNRSTIYERQDKLALMEYDFRHVLTINPDDSYALNGLGYFLTIRTDRYDEAYQLIQRALELRPTDASIIDSMGWVTFKLGRIDEAIKHLQKAFAIYPAPEVAAHLGEALWVKGREDEAKAIWENNLQDNPDAPEILETLERLGVTL